MELDVLSNRDLDRLDTPLQCTMKLLPGGLTAKSRQRRIKFKALGTGHRQQKIKSGGSRAEGREQKVKSGGSRAKDQARDDICHLKEGAGVD